MKKILLGSSAIVAIMLPFSAQAQSTGSIDFGEEDVIVVTGVRDQSVGGIEIPDTPKAKQVLEEEIIRRQRPGQTVNDIINLVPGVSFQNNDPWGSSGGGFTIRGFGADRVSQTIDGLPLNDSGNYAIYSGQQVDPEVLEEISVNLGVTDVDSPTASAAGGTVNIRTRVPGYDPALVTTLTVGDVLASNAFQNSLYARGFAMIDTGDLTGNGLRAFLSGSYTTYGVPYNPYSEVDKTQFNGRIFQDLGVDGDFISVAGHWNVNRNNFAGSQNLEDLLGFYDDTYSKEDRFNLYEGDGEYPCQVPDNVLVGGNGTPGVSDRYSDRPPSCGAAFYRRYNPSDTGNIRGSSRFTLAEDLIFTFDPSYQYVKANGGGPDDLREGFFDGLTGAFNGAYYFGRDLNDDGDTLDRIAGNDPSQTVTNRFGLITNLIYDVTPDHRVRVAYTWDRARHRQTGQITNMLANGEPSDPFAIDNPLLDVYGNEINKRDRLSYAILHQVSGEYRGRFLDDSLTAVLGLRAPFFTRELNQNCYTTSVNGFVDCPAPGQDLTEYEANNPDYVAPLSRTYEYDKLLPNIGLTFAVTDNASVFANYAKGLSVPGTDPLYDSLYVRDAAPPVPETTDSFDLGLRFQQGRITAQIAGWYTKYRNRLASAFDPTARDGEGAVIFRNLGTVDKYGIDGSVAYRPTRNSLLYVFGSWNESEIETDTSGGVCELDRDGNVENTKFGCTTSTLGQEYFLPTAGNEESGTPGFTYGGRAQIAFGDLELGVQAKRTGPRFISDLNTEKAPAYTLVDLDARYNIAEFPTGGNVAVQVNVTNIFDEYYIGYFGGSLNDFGFAQIGAPRAGSVSLIIGY